MDDRGGGGAHAGGATGGVVDMVSKSGTNSFKGEVWATTIVVILTSVVFGIYLFSIDLALSNLVTWVIGRFSG